MGLTKRKGGWYVEFPVVDDGKVLQLARGTPGSKLKRWKILITNKTVAKQIIEGIPDMSAFFQISLGKPEEIQKVLELLEQTINEAAPTETQEPVPAS